VIFVLEMPVNAEPQAWFAFDLDDLLSKIEARDPSGMAALSSAASPAAADDGPGASQRCRIYWDEAEAMAAFERSTDALWQGAGWRARWALREQLVATEVLADDA
jgi:hypothetical protein